MKKVPSAPSPLPRIFCALIKPLAPHAPEIGGLGPVFDQDDSNMPAVQKGMMASKKGAVSLASYQESRIRHLHQTLDKYLNA